MMSQEEIEALMNGLDTQSEATKKVESKDELSDEPKIEVDNKVDNNDIENLLKEIQTSDKSNNEEELAVTNSEDKVLDSKENIINEKAESEKQELLTENDLSCPQKDLNFENGQDLLNKENKINSENKINEIEKWADQKINRGILPFPAKKDTKVVNQLSQVANDSEEKVGQIFDALSLILDKNNSFKTQVDSIKNCLTNQKKLLEKLEEKFPNISLFETHSNEIKKVFKDLDDLRSFLDVEDAKIFEAMELMQFNDINRQKIERVVSVIKKLSVYLNNLFGDDGSVKDPVVAKHISGDNNSELVGEELENLISEYSKKE